MRDPYIFQRTLDLIPKQPQRQDSLTCQLQSVMMIANRIGCYDAADFINQQILEKVKL